MTCEQRYIYLVEGECEEKLLRVFKEQGNIIQAGKIRVFNAVLKQLSDADIRQIPPNAIVVLIFDTDAGNIQILETNLSLLKKKARVKEVWCVLQVKNLEDELKRSTTIKEIKDLTGSSSNKEYKHDLIHEKHLFQKLTQHGFNLAAFWVTPGNKPFEKIVNCGNKIKIK